MKTTTRLLAPFVGAWLMAANAAQAEYDYHIFQYPGASDVQTFGINDRGQVVGNASIGGTSFPFVYDSKKQIFTDVPVVAGYDRTGVIGISDSGLLSGTVFSADSDLTEGLFIDKNGTTTVFAHPEAVSFTQARGVNNRGQITGFRDSPDDRFQPENGFIYDAKTGEFTDIVPSLFTIAQGINNQGEVVGSALFFANEAPCPLDEGLFTGRFGWVRAADGTVNYFRVNGSNTSARGISDSGKIAGFVTSGLVTKAFVLEGGVENCEEFIIADEDLLAIPDSTRNVGASINNAGQVSIGATTVDGSIAAVASPVPPKGKKK